MTLFRRCLALRLRCSLHLSFDAETKLPNLRSVATRLRGRRNVSPKSVQLAPRQSSSGLMFTPDREFPSEEAREAISRIEHWYHRIEIAPGIVTPGVHNSEAAGFEVTRSRPVGGRGLVVGRKTEDAETTFFRNLDRGVVNG